jgi:hypothetical protein
MIGMEQDYDMTEVDLDGAEWDTGEVDDVLDALMESADGNGFAEFRGLIPGMRRPTRRPTPQRGVPAARGAPAYRQPTAPGGPVTQAQLKEALDRVGADVRRNAQGIKTINTRLNTLDGRVTNVVSVAATQTRQITALERRMRIDGALDFAQSVSTSRDGAALNVNVVRLLSGAAKTGMLGDLRGPLGNPALIGGLGLVLNNPGILGGIFNPQP